ncbi:MAG: hypothetical protein OHK0039_04160 [Bacteroidia bacterium]
MPYTQLTGPVVLRLDGPWVDADGRVWRVPFEVGGQTEARFTYRLPDSLPDSLLLHLEGLACEAELWLDGSYLSWYPGDLRPQTVPLPVDARRRSITLRCRQGSGYPFAPRSAPGLPRPLSLITPAQRAALERPLLSRQRFADTLALVAPYFGRHGLAFDEHQALRILYPLREQGIGQIYFAFEPDQQMQALCAQMGMVRVDSLLPGILVFPVNAYPYRRGHLPQALPFWFDTAGYRTPYYGDATHWGAWYRATAPSGGASGLMVVLALLPLLSAFVLKTLSPTFWYNQQSLLFQPKLYIENTYDASFTQTGLPGFLMLLKVLNLAAALTLVVWYVGQHQLWHVTGWLRGTSLVETLYLRADSIGAIYLRSVLLVGGWVFVRWVLMQLIGGLFRIKGLAAGVTELNISGSYPVVLLFPLPGALLVLGERAVLPVLVLGGLLFGVYWVRRIYMLFLGLGRRFMFSTAMKFLYICAFNIGPYLFLL